jgi:hypothetical protein
MPADFEKSVDEQIERAREQGGFDNLPGAGKPLKHLDTHPLQAVLKAQGFTPRWVDLDHEIRQKTEVAEQSVRRTYEWVMQTLSGGSADPAFARDEWHRARRIFRERIDGINKLIRTYNLQVPSTVGQKFLLREEDELQRLGLTTEIV